MNGQSNHPFIVRVDGEIDLDTAPALRRALAAALEAHREVVLDLSEVTFMDCAGLGALVRARNQADRSGRRLILRGAGRCVVRLLELTGLHRRLAAEPRAGTVAPDIGTEGEPQ
ncbi:STAS domain-containing protein [Kitasatospora sp. NPDC004615]|uniref:STAS domain-containing protein n=1 Tax=Kitasatospora sp. NPDC004615 TaxID=3364017 RepID=UPI0036AB4E3B